MKPHVAFLVFPLAFGCCLLGQADEPGRIRALSYNIHHAEGMDGRLDVERIATIIRSTDPDIVALQEVDRNTLRTDNVDQAAQIAALTNLSFVFGANIELQGGQYGNAVLSRWPIVNHQNHQLPRINNGEQRGAIDALIESPHGIIRVLATHLDHRSDPTERMESIKLLSLKASVMPAGMRTSKPLDIPTILAGDLNADWNSAVMDEARKRWTIPHAEPLPTIPVAQPTKQIDFVLFRPADVWKAVETRVLDESIASDHRAILSVLELIQKPSP